jgi:hypothetical protein
MRGIWATHVAFSHCHPPLIYYLTERSLLKKCPPPHGKILKKGPDLIGYDGVNARVPGHNLKTNARPLGKLRVENAPPRGRFYSRFHETLTTNVPNFVAKFASSLRCSEAHIGIYESL